MPQSFHIKHLHTTMGTSFQECSKHCTEDLLPFNSEPGECVQVEVDDFQCICNGSYFGNDVWENFNSCHINKDARRNIHIVILLLDVICFMVTARAFWLVVRRKDSWLRQVANQLLKSSSSKKPPQVDMKAEDHKFESNAVIPVRTMSESDKATDAESEISIEEHPMDYEGSLFGLDFSEMKNFKRQLSLPEASLSSSKHLTAE